MMRTARTGMGPPCRSKHGPGGIAFILLLGGIACGGGSGGGNGTADGGSDTAPAATTAAWASCAGHFADMSARSAVDIVFGGGSGLVYVPNCVTVKAGTVVTWSGDFATHPLISASSNPGSDVKTTTAGTSATATLTTVGFAGFYCGVHGTAAGGGMAGNIQVAP